MQVLTNPIPAFDIGHPDVEAIRDQIQRVSFSNRVAQRMQRISGAGLIDTDGLRKIGFGPSILRVSDRC